MTFILQYDDSIQDKKDIDQETILFWKQERREEGVGGSHWKGPEKFQPM